LLRLTSPCPFPPPPQQAITDSAYYCFDDPHLEGQEEDLSPLQQHPQQQKQASSKKGTGGRSGALSMEDALGPFRRGTEEDNQFFDMDTDDPFKVSGGVV